jgi:hypothetical protein
LLGTVSPLITRAAALQRSQQGVFGKMLPLPRLSAYECSCFALIAHFSS